MSQLFEVEAVSIKSNLNNIRQAYYEDGAFIVRKLLTISLINEVASQIIKMIELIDNSIAKNNPFSVSTDVVKAASWMLQEIDRQKPGSQSVIYDALNHTPLMYKIATNDELIGVLQKILSPNLLIHPRLIVLMSMPDATWHLARWHQDFYYNEGPESTCTVYAPLQYTNAKNGGLIIAKKALKLGSIPHSENDHGVSTKWNTIPFDVISGFEDLAQIEMDAGDVLFLHSLCPHTAQVNKSEHVRFVINLRYRDMTDKKYLENNWYIREIVEAREALTRKEK